MEHGQLGGFRILVAEDEFAVAEYVCEELREHGAQIVGPVACVSDARLITQDQQFDVALLDVNLRGQMVFPVLDALEAREIPYLLVTGYDDSTLPTRYLQSPRCLKPVSMDIVVTKLAELAGRVGQ